MDCRRSLVKTACVGCTKKHAKCSWTEPTGLSDTAIENVIKCICGTTSDDGNTVLCENYNTWQHIKCYHGDKPVPDVHLCIDCGPKVARWGQGTPHYSKPALTEEEFKLDLSQRRKHQKTPKSAAESVPLLTSLQSYLQSDDGPATETSRYTQDVTRDYIQVADLGRPDGLSPESRSSRAQKHPATFQCTLCSKRFMRAYNLRSHLRTHTDEGPFVCELCGEAFARQRDRRRHEGLHSGEEKK
jgi:hypothetical protein